jgi:hypothetical protein
MRHLSTDQLNAGVPHIEASPSDGGTVEMIVRRPDVDGREVIEDGELLVGEGLAGDNYVTRGNPRTDGGEAHPEAQLTLMNSRSVDTVAAGDRDRWPLAGDQLFVDFDLSTGNLPTGTRLAIGSAVVEVTAKPHNGCSKFAERYGMDAARWVNSRSDLRLRGINAAVIETGTFRVGDVMKKLG